MNRSLGIIAFRAIGGIAVVAGSFFVTLFLLDRFGSPPVAAAVTVVEASYGANCKASPGNLTAYVAKACDQKGTCNLPVDVGKMGDPAPGCGKEFSVKFRCRQDASIHSISIPSEANGKTLDLDCTKD